VIATNENDILHRFIANADYTKRECKATLAPAMDITIPSNFERYLYVLAGEDGALVAQWMEQTAATGTFDLAAGDRTKEDRLAELREVFSSAAATDAEINTAIALHQERYGGYTHCPHTACGIHAYEHVMPKDEPYIVMATAHHGKFGIALSEAEALEPALPVQLKAVAEEGRESRCEFLPNDSELVRKFLIDAKAKSAAAADGDHEARSRCCQV
jgi:threonine synthase